MELKGDKPFLNLTKLLALLYVAPNYFKIIYAFLVLWTRLIWGMFVFNTVILYDYTIAK